MGAEAGEGRAGAGGSVRVPKGTRDLLVSVELGWKRSGAGASCGLQNRCRVLVTVSGVGSIPMRFRQMPAVGGNLAKAYGNGRSGRALRADRRSDSWVVVRVWRAPSSEQVPHAGAALQFP